MRSDREYARVLDESFQDHLSPGAILAGLALIAVGTAHTPTPLAGRPYAGPLELGLGLFWVAAGLALWLRSRRGRRLSPRQAQIFGAVGVLSLFAKNGFYLVLDPSPAYPVGFLLGLVILGVIPFATPTFVAACVISLGSWLVSMAVAQQPLTAFADSTAVLLATIAFTTAIRLWRGRHLRRMAGLERTAEDAARARSRSETRYREMTEHSNDMIVELDEDGTILYANPAHRTALGLEPEALIGRPASDVLGAAFDRSSDLIDDEPSRRRLIRVRHRDGRSLVIEGSFRAFTLDSGERRIVVSSRDVTESVESRQALEMGRIELEALVEERTAALHASLLELRRTDRLAAMGTLAAGIAHQINNPIGSIQMSAELALLSEDDGGDVRSLWREALRNNVDQAKRCGRIVASMLQFARNEPTVRERCDLADLVLRVCGQTEPFARGGRILIDASGVRSPLPVMVSAIDIEQALVNILRNAAESAPRDVHIFAAARAEGDEAVVTIRDDGAGMDATEVEHAFDPFFTTRLKRGGTGLGLSVAHGVITDCGGTVSIESTPGEGTTVELRLPLLPRETGQGLAADSGEDEDARGAHAVGASRLPSPDLEKPT